MQIRFSQLQTAMLRKGYKFFNDGDYNLNLIGIRSSDINSNQFNDFLCVAFYTDGGEHLFVFEATTDPGMYWRENPANVEGTAIVMPGQYLGLWCLGKHRGEYAALVQQKPVRVYRDNNKDDCLDMAAGDAGYFGINCHRARANGESLQVDRWSAGCQVLASASDFDVLMALCKKSHALYGGGFSYTLLVEEDLRL